MKDINENVTLVQLMDSLGNVNHDISIFGFWISESNYKKALVLNRSSLEMMFAPWKLKWLILLILQMLLFKMKK